MPDLREQILDTLHRLLGPIETDAEESCIDQIAEAVLVVLASRDQQIRLNLEALCAYGELRDNAIIYRHANAALCLLGADQQETRP